MQFVSLLICSCFGLTIAAPPIQEQWKSFKVHYKKSYLNDTEEALRFSAFTENMKEIEKHNANYAEGKVSYSLRMNQFADLRPEEFSSYFSGYNKELPKTKNILAQEFTYPRNLNVPDSIDWREKGAVTPVKNQELCKGCWSFSATGAMEGQLFRSTGKLVSLSEQQLIDCSTPQGNMGCNGGRMEMAFQYIIEAGGLMSEDRYPFLGKDGKCMFSSDSTVNGSLVTSYVQLLDEDEGSLKLAVATVGPVSVAVAASSRNFMLYNGGIMTKLGCGDHLDHAVLVVGYGTESGKDYWIVKNSWGTNWGEKGYVRVERNKGNACGLATFPSYPVLVYSKKDVTPPTDSPPVPGPTPTGKTIANSAWNAALSSGPLLFTSLFCLYFSRKI